MDTEAIRSLVDEIEQSLDEISDLAGSSSDPADFEEEATKIDEAWSKMKRLINAPEIVTDNEETE